MCQVILGILTIKKVGNLPPPWNCWTVKGAKVVHDKGNTPKPVAILFGLIYSPDSSYPHKA